MNQVQPPKTRYLKTDAAKNWSAAVTGETVRTTADFAMLQFVFEQESASQTLEQASRNALRLEGARRFMSVFLNLAEKELDKPIKMAGDNLNE